VIKLDANELNPSQLAWVNSRARYSLMCAGVGSGKSTAGIVKILLLKGENGTLPGLVIAQTFSQLYANIVNPLLKLTGNLPVRYRPTLVSSGKDAPFLKWRDGCRVYLRSAELPKGYDGLTVAWLYGDEIKDWTENAFLVAIARVRIKGAPRTQRCFTSTPVFNWMTKHWKDRDDRETIRCSTYENERNLDADYITDLVSAYSTRMARAMLHGEWIILEGGVFEDFDPDPRNSRWIVDDWPTPHEFDQSKCYLAVDPAYRKSAWIWLIRRETPIVHWMIYDQMMADNMSDDVCVHAVNERKHPIDEIWCDPAAKAKQSQTGTSTLRSLRDINTRGFTHDGRKKRSIRTLAGRSRDIEFGIERMRVLLGGYDNGTEEGAPIRLVWHRRVVEAEKGRERGSFKDIASSAYPEFRGRVVDDQPIKDGIVDHSRDALRYWSTGMWMTERFLRKSLKGFEGTGYQVAA
jgi:hypothetical protein